MSVTRPEEPPAPSASDATNRHARRCGGNHGSLGRIEQRLDKLALKSELLDLRNRVDALEEQVRILEARLEE